jgi:hypothetical protein
MTAAEWIEATLAAGFTFGASFDIDQPVGTPWDGSFAVMRGTNAGFGGAWPDLKAQLDEIGLEAVQAEMVRRFPNGGRR